VTLISLTDLQQPFFTGEQERRIIDYPISSDTVADLSSNWSLEALSASVQALNLKNMFLDIQFNCGL